MLDDKITFGVCTCNDINAYEPKITNLVQFDDYNSALQYYKKYYLLTENQDDLDIDKCNLKDNIWLVYIQNNALIQFEQLTWNIKCKYITIKKDFSTND